MVDRVRPASTTDFSINKVPNTGSFASRRT
jgi:hypothetical protein